MNEEQCKYYDKALERFPEINPAYQSLIIAELEKRLEEYENMIERITKLVDQYEFK